MPRKGSRFVKTLATFEIVKAADSLLQHIARILTLSAFVCL